MNRLVVIGNGMAGVACIEQILKHAPKFDVTVFGEETRVNYNRILLSSVLAGEKSSDDIVRSVFVRLRACVTATVGTAVFVDVAVGDLSLVSAVI